MVLADDDDETQLEVSPFWYARVIGVFHANIRWRDEPNVRQLDFIWVRWYGREKDYQFGEREARLEKIGFITEGDDTPAFGFIDPKTIVRAVHLIPDFTSGRTNALMGPSALARVSKYERDSDEDWTSYYVNKSVEFVLNVAWVTHMVIGLPIATYSCISEAVVLDIRLDST